MCSARRFSAGLAIVAMLGTSMMSPQMVRRLGVLGFACAPLGALALLPFFGTDFGKGAIRWFSLGFASFQPSEFLKPCFVIVCGLADGGQPGPRTGRRGKTVSFALTMIIVGLLAMQPDFGQAALVLFGWGVMYFVAGAPFASDRLWCWGWWAAAGCSPTTPRSISPVGSTGSCTPDVDPRTQLGYAANAIQEGGFFGVGVGEGQVKWSLPDAHTDFIIAVAAEEYGLILVLLIIALYATVTVRSLFRLMKERDPFIRLAGTGLACIFGVQAMINMGVAVRLLPAKGMTLPFVSYGGSSVIAAGITVGMLLAFTRARPQGQIGDILFKRGR